MAATVLGKRSRAPIECQEGATRAFRPFKKVNRSAAPFIFEDVQRATTTQLPSSERADTCASLQNAPSGCIEIRATRNPNWNDAELVNNENQSPSSDSGLTTPSAQRFKDVCSVPFTPRHKIRAVSAISSSRPLKTLASTKVQRSAYAQAKSLFTPSATSTRLIGRDRERSQLMSFLQRRQQGGCTYISGPPGTGKSALVDEVLLEFQDQPNTKICKLNCVTMRTASQVYERLLAGLSPEATPTQRSAETSLKRLVSSSTDATSYIVVLDEIDSLVDEECHILYNVFEWALNPTSRLTLIGIANALDLTDRFLPRLKARGLTPTLLPFLPYTAHQISTIITDKLRSLNQDSSADIPCVHPAAIQLCGKKIASQSGDVRKAFALIRRAIEQVEQEHLAKQLRQAPVLGEIELNSDRVETSHPTPAKVMIGHIVKLAASIFNNSTASRLAHLNLQQKAVLCSLAKKETRCQNRDPFTTPTKSAHKAPTVRELYSTYNLLCKGHDGLLQPLKDTEFRDVIASLETLGLVHESQSRSSSLLTPTSSSSRCSHRNDERQIVSGVTRTEIADSLTGCGADLLRRLLDEA